MLHYNSVEWFLIKGRGRVASLRADNPTCSWDEFFTKYAPALGDYVCIEGQIYRVHGVETFKPASARAYEPIGILVGDESTLCPDHDAAIVL